MKEEEREEEEEEEEEEGGEGGGGEEGEEGRRGEEVEAPSSSVNDYRPFILPSIGLVNEVFFRLHPRF